MSAGQVAALFVRSDSFYKSMPGVDCWDIERDARKWPGGSPVVAHPPCRAWGKLRAFAKPRHDEKELAFFAIEQVRRFGGVLEHPRGSSLWQVAGLPSPVAGMVDDFGGWTLPVFQCWFGHRAEKSTLLYIVGCVPRDLPAIPIRLGEASHVVGLWSGRDKGNWRKSITKAEREHTPPDFARWLVDVAARCTP
ncbi:MAG: hypothetical protein ACOYBP_09155 [Microbacteriaceae bacterium]